MIVAGRSAVQRYVGRSGPADRVSEVVLDHAFDVAGGLCMT